MEGKVVVDLATLAINIPVWSVVTGSVGLVSFGVGLALLAVSVKNSVKSNIAQNNINHNTQMQALINQNDYLEQIICLTQEQLYSIGKPNYHYDGKCERLKS